MTEKDEKTTLDHMVPAKRFQIEMALKGNAYENHEESVGALRFGEENPYYKRNYNVRDPFWEPFEQDMSVYPQCNLLY